MDSLYLINIINKIPLFEGLNEKQAESLIQLCSSTDLKPDDVLMREGSIQSEMFLLLSGRLKVTVQDQNLIIANIKNVGVIGEIETLLNQPCCATVTAETPSRLLKIASTKLTSLFSSDTEMGMKIYRNLCKLLSEKVVCDNVRLKDACNHLPPDTLKDAKIAPTSANN